MSYKYILVPFIISLLVATGCTVVHTVPLAGRQGDTIFVTVGSPDNEINRANTDLTYTPSGGSPIAIPDSAIISVFNLYPSKISAAWLYSSANSIENIAGHGPWTTVMAISLPDDGSLPVGVGSIQVSTTAAYTAPLSSPNGVDIALEILPGTGAPSSFDYLGFGQIQLAGNLAELESMPRLEFRPTYTGFDSTNTYGAVEVKITMNKTGINEDDFNIIVDDKIGTVQTRNVHTNWNAQDLETTVYFISPTGELQYSDVSFSIISTALLIAYETAIFSIPTDTDVNTTWYDIDGNVTTGPAIRAFNLTGF